MYDQIFFPFLIIINLQNMNKARGHRKDVSRILKTIKLQESALNYYDTINDNTLNYAETKQIGPRIVYASNTRRNDNLKGSKTRKYRYDRVSTQNERSSSLGTRQQQHSLELKNSNFLKISQKRHENNIINRNPYMQKQKISSVSKGVRRYSNPSKRLISQETIQTENIKKSFNFNTISFHHPLNSINLLEEAKILSGNGSYMQSENIIQTILRENPQNRQALSLSGQNNFYQMNYLKAIYAFNKLIEIDPTYNKNAYILSSICQSNKGMKQEAMQRINACITYFPDYYDAHFQKAKLYLKINETESAIKSLKNALKLTKQPYECCLKLGECYERENMHDLALKLYEKVLKESKSPKSLQFKHICLLKKAQCQKIVRRFKQYVSTLTTYLKVIEQNTAVNLVKIHYQIAYGYYKIQDYSNAIMKIEQVFDQKSKKESTDALILLTLINIKKRDFYQAYHSLARKTHLDIDDGKIIVFEKFCEGVLSLMKRKFEVGLEKLVQIQSKVCQICKDEFQMQISNIYPMYLAYGYFCTGRTDKCIRIYQNQIQQNKPELRVYKKSVQYNLQLCEGIEEVKQKRLPSAKSHFQKSTVVYPHKPEGFLYLAVTLIQLYLKQHNQVFLKRANTALVSCISNLKQLNNNYAASAFYVKACISAFMGEWDSSINQIDQCIQRAEDNDHKSFFLKGLIFACCQNYKQAISQISIAISLNNKEPGYYLLRSKCQQIQGDGSRAFLDLQQYISMCPQDTQIHKFAGNLLFQNGAFQDALQAYENREINYDISNYDVFLTRAKTHFLLGNFQKCVEDMTIANRLKQNDGNISFDISVINILNDFFQQDKQTNISISRAYKARDQLENLAAFGEDIDYGRIFKKVQISMLLSLFLFYMGQYRQAARQLKETLIMKKQIVTLESQYQEQTKEREFFISQMHYNRAVCFLMLSEHLAAIKALEQCKVEYQSKTYNRMIELINILREKKSEQKFLEVFSQKNKMSRFLNEVSVNLGSSVIKLKLSIPFPKVEPPQINPKFQIKILREIDIESIEKKPEAPWIIREENSIKFTDKIQQFSRLQINNSELSKKNDKVNYQEFENEPKSFQSLSELRQKLKLDDKIENKLNKLLKKQQ